MLEYPIGEATELLTNNLDNAMKSLAGVEEDLEYITEQCTTLEVGILIIIITHKHCSLFSCISGNVLLNSS